MQTIPALALLVLLLVLLGGTIGATPAIIALFLYSLLPIVRNTYTGLHDIPLPLRESAHALGLSPWPRLYLIELPLASRILAGIKTAAVINVGYATLGGLIGGGVRPAHHGRRDALRRELDPRRRGARRGHGPAGASTVRGNRSAWLCPGACACVRWNRSSRRRFCEVSLTGRS